MTDSPFLPPGKLPHRLLDQLLRGYSSADARLIVGPQMGEDAAVIDFGATYLVAKTDPITFATDEIGWYAVNVNANDIAVMGATPRWFLVTVLLPEKSATAALAQSIHNQIAAACKELGVAVAGGHTEITIGLERPIVAGFMLGEVAPDRLVRSSGVQPGDALILAGSVPVEGTALVAREMEGELLAKGVDPALLRRAQGFLHDPGISVVRAAQLAITTAPVHAMHDPTEGGVATGIWEVAQASGVGMEIVLDAIPVCAESRVVCDALGLDPLGTIASGALLLAVAPEYAAGLLAAFHDNGLTASVIGKASEYDGDLTATLDGQEVAFPRFAVDEIARLFG